jgi:hypothetical protein
VAFKLICFFSSCHVKYLDTCVFICYKNKFIAFVKYCTIWRWKSTVKLTRFFDHSDVPNFIDTITVTWDNQISPLVKLDGINSIIVAIECLHTQIGSDIPQWDCFISWTRYKHAGIRLPVNWVYWIYMASESKSTCFCLYHVPKLNWMVHWAWNQKVSRIMELTLPNRLPMLWVCSLTSSI